MKNKFIIRICLILTIILTFFIISCGNENEETIECSDNNCYENSHCETDINDIPSCKCNEEYTQVGEECIKNQETEIYNLFVTGETKTIAQNDDGNTQRGIQRSYEMGNDIIIDKRTGLIWQNEESYSMNLEDAEIYCNKLNLESNSHAELDSVWRLANINELLTIIDLKFYPAISPLFTNVKEKQYWTNTKLNENAYSINFSDGGINLLETETSNEVICVSGDFINNNKKPNLTWEDLESSKDNTELSPAQVIKTWNEAITYCENLELNTYSDWHLPNINELYSILEENNLPYQYWSSTISQSENIRTLDFELHKSSLIDRSSSLNTRCVRHNTDTSYRAGEWGDIILNDRYTTPKDSLFIDIRTESEIASGYPSNSVSGAVYSSSDTQRFISDIERISNNDKTKHIILTCASSGRSSSAVKLLSDNGFTHIEHIIGGTSKWKSFGLGWEN